MKPPFFLSISCCAALSGVALAGPFPPAADTAGSDAIAGVDARFTLWASGAEVVRGPANIAAANPIEVGFGEEANALGPPDATPSEPYTVVSLGDGGSATLTFSQPFGDVPGPDFAVFENAFNNSFLELAHVEVSSDGIHFFRFPSISVTPASANLGEGGVVDPTNVHNLAGKYRAGFGTPFDLAELAAFSPALDIQRITHVRVVDVVGTNDPAFGSRDSTGAMVIDPYPTNFFTGGFDLDAVGAFAATTIRYDDWAASRGLAGAAAAATADPDADGVPNLIAYLTGNGRLEVRPAPGAVTLSFARLAYRSGGLLRVEASTDFVHWTPVAAAPDASPVEGVAAGVTVVESGEFLKTATVTVPAGAARFFRLAAERAPGL